MNILYICDEYPPGRHGGIGTAVQILAREMVQQGHTVIVAGFYDWAYGGEDEFDDNGVKVYRFRRGLKLPAALCNADSLPARIAYRLLNASGIFQRDIKKSIKKYEVFLQELVVRHHIDIVEVPDYHDYMRFCSDVVPFPQLTVPTVVKLHGSMTYFAREAGQAVTPAIAQMEQSLFNAADAWASVSNYTLEKTIQYMQLQPKMSAVVYNGVHIQPVVKVEKVPGKVVFSGTLVHKKGIYQLAKAWNEVSVQVPGAELWIFGKGDTEKLKALLHADTTSTVFFKGHVPRGQLLQELATANVAVFPSYAETFGMAAIEAMACGTAVIFTTLTSGPEVIDDKVNGMLVNPDDVKGISNDIIFLLKNSAVCNNLAEMGRKKVAEQFDIRVIAVKHLDFYLDVINTGRIA